MQTGTYLISPGGISKFTRRKDIIGALKRELRLDCFDVKDMELGAEEEQLNILLSKGQWRLERIENE